ncbi:MAG: lytic murein transglycosylase [bacterium]|nr:lytic murein transglycosylase [bacterium]
MKKKSFGCFILSLFLFILPFYPVFAATQEEIERDIANKNKQIEDLQKQIDAYNQQVSQKQRTAASVQEEIQRLAGEIKKSELELQSLSLAIDGINLQINKVEEKIKELEMKIEKNRNDLTGALRLMQKSEQVTPLEMMVSKPNLSSFFSDLYDLYFLQSGVKRQVVDLRESKQALQEMRDELDADLDERQKLKMLQEIAKQRALNKRVEQKQVLNKVKKEETQIVSKRKMVEVDLGRLKEQITYLVKAGVSVEDAIRYGKLAAIRSGIRPAFLIAVLDIESRLGLNVGKGNWQTDMHSRDRDAFASICAKLNLDPDKTPVSKKPGYGWGGAMGPAQFLPNTWLAYEGEVAKLTSHNPPSPWNIEDAFTAAAVMLARRGATSKNRIGETAAAKAYISGSSSCAKSICNYYANAVLDKADEIEDNIGS